MSVQGSQLQPLQHDDGVSQRGWPLAFEERPGPLDTPCQVWTGYCNRHGYGRKNVAGRWRLVHRLAWEQTHGPVPAGMELCHECDVPPCIAIEHLSLCTHADNMRDAATRGRLGSAKLTPDDVRAVRAALAAGEPRAVVARRFDVSVWTIGGIVRGRVWRWVA
jgi:hypothetical protein